MLTSQYWHLFECQLLHLPASFLLLYQGRQWKRLKSLGPCHPCSDLALDWPSYSWGCHLGNDSVGSRISLPGPSVTSAFKYVNKSLKIKVWWRCSEMRRRKARRRGVSGRRDRRKEGQEGGTAGSRVRWDPMCPWDLTSRGSCRADT